MSNFEKADPKEHHKYIAQAKAVPYGRVYPLSMTEGEQTGDIFTDGKAVLFWHYCGFGCISGEADSAFLDNVHRLMKEGGRRLVLFADDRTAAYFEGCEDTVTEKRLFFEYPEDRQAEQHPVPDGYEIGLLTPWQVPQLTGRIVPAFSWENDRQFLDGGTGFCVTYQGKPCAWAFSAAVSSEEVDIGVETAESFRQKGLACAAAAMTAAAVKEHGKKPVWACHAQNRASAALAQKLGFVKTAECFVIHIA